MLRPLVHTNHFKDITSGLSGATTLTRVPLPVMSILNNILSQPNGAKSESSEIMKSAIPVKLRKAS